MKFSDLSSIINGTMELSEDIEITHFSTDTRELAGTDSEVFIALKANRNGHDFVDEAIEKGTKNFILSDTRAMDSVNIFQVEDTLAAFQKIAESHRQKFDIPIVAITGSNGKTTVKEWLATLLSTQLQVCKSPKSYNSQIGVPHSVLMLNDTHQVGLFEAGISKVGEMSKLARIIQPEMGIFTMLGAAHDEGFENREEKLSEKLMLFEKCKKVIVPKDVPYFSQIMAQLGSKVIAWGTAAEANYFVQWNSGQVVVNNYTFSTSLKDKASLENLTSAIVAAIEMGIPNEQIQNGLEMIKPVPMRLEMKKGINDTFIIDDSYNNDLDGIIVAINTLAGFQQKRRKTIILSDVPHLNVDSKNVYQAIAKTLNERGIDRLIGIGIEVLSMKKFFQGEARFYLNTSRFLENPPSFNQEVILVKGARNFALEKVVASLQERMHGTRLEINIDAMRRNLHQYQQLISSATKMMVMVKANAYGMGILEIAGFLQNHKVDMLGVAYVDEAILLRKNGIHLPIMIMNPHIESFAMFDQYDLQAEVFNLDHLHRLLSDTVGTIKIHLKIETGMHRLGFSIEELEDVLSIIVNEDRIEVAGVFTHFAGADGSAHDNFTRYQAAIFELAYDKVEAALGYSPVKHASNSAGIVRWPAFHFDMVRLGIGLYGIDPTHVLKLEKVAKLISVISHIQNLEAGDTVGYSRKGKVEKKSKIAVIPIGYEDGFGRILGNGKASVHINGRLFPTIGNICMDMMMVDVTGSDVKTGDEVEIFGENPTVEEIASWGNTIAYETFTNISPRVRRVYFSG